MPNSQIEDEELQQKLKSINSVDIQTFSISFLNKVSEFHNSYASNKTFSFIQENFIKKYRFKNSLPQNNSDPHSTITQFINGFKQTHKFYESYHQCKFILKKDLQSILDKFIFTKDLKRFITQLYKSQTKTINFFLTELQFHRVFMAQNEAKYHKKVENLNEICSSCRQSMVRKSFQNIKQQVGYNFNDPYKLYEKGKYTKLNDMGHLSYLDSLHPLQRIQQLQQADQKIRQLIKESKKIHFSQLDEIYEHFDARQEIQIETLNRGKVNEMFYDLQTQLDNQSSQLQQYVDQLMGFNDRLNNYNPSGTKVLQQQEKGQTEPKDVQKQLKYNLSKIIRKIYKKIIQIVEKRKKQAISQETQVNFTNQSVVKEMQKNKRRLELQLKQSKEQKKFLTSALKQQNDTLKKQIQRLSHENNKIDIQKQETMLEKNNMIRKQEKLMKVISQLKKQIQRLTMVIDRKQYLASKKELLMSENKLKSRVNLDINEPQQIKEQLRQSKDKHAITSSKRTSKRHLMGLVNIEHHESQTQSIPSSDHMKSPEQQLLEEMHMHELHLINEMAKKKLKNTKKKYLQPRRSKITEIVTLEESDLKKQVNRLSQARLKEMQELKRLSQQNEQNEQSSSEKNESQGEQFDDQFLNGQQYDEAERMVREPTIKEVIERNQNQEQSQFQNQQISHHQLPKNHKSKTFTKINQQYDLQSIQRGKSSRQVSETQEDIQQKLDQLRKLQKMKQLEIKLAVISNKNPDQSFKKIKFPHRSPEKFKIQKQVQQSFNSPKINKSVDRMNSLTKKGLPSRVHHQSLYKDDLLKRFGRSSQNFQQSPIQSKPSLSHLQLPGSTQNPKSSNQHKRNSSISIASKNFLSLCEQVTKHVEDNKFHIGTQTQWPREEILRMLYQFQLQSKNWNEVLVPYDCYKFGYQEFISQLCQLIAKQEKNPIRRLNGFKGSSDVLKKPHNYRFNKENLYYFNLNGQKEDQGLNISDDEIKIKKMLHKNSDEKHYFIPRLSNQFSKSLIDNPRMNQTTMGGFFRYQNKGFEQNQQRSMPQKPLGSCVSLLELKNSQKHFKNFDPSGLFIEASNGNFKKKGVYTLNQMKTDGNSREMINNQRENNKLPTINQGTETMRLPTFQKQDAENLFFTIESAKTIQENIKKNIDSKTQLNFFTLEKQQIRFTTEILAILAHVHLLQPQSYNQIKNILLYPAKVLTNKRGQIQINNSNQSQKNQMQNNETQLSLKNGLGYVVQLHRKCKIQNTSGKQRSRTKDNLRFAQNSLKSKSSSVCTHLISFRKKIGEVIRVHQALKNKILMP